MDPKRETESNGGSPFRRPGCTCDGAQPQPRFDLRRRLRQALVVGVALTLPILIPVLVWCTDRRSARVAIECPSVPPAPKCKTYITSSGGKGEVQLWIRKDWGTDDSIIYGVMPDQARALSTSLGCELVP